MTAIFLYIILGATDDRAPKGLALDGTPLNPARSLGVAWFAGDGALAQVWLFIIGPIVGAAIAGATYAIITGAGTGDVGVAQNPELERRQQAAGGTGVK